LSSASNDDGVDLQLKGSTRTKEKPKACLLIIVYMKILSIIDASIKRSNQKKIYKLEFKLRKKKLISTQLCFPKVDCCTVVQRKEDMAPFFNYELRTIPISLFKDNYLCKTDKTQLSKVGGAISTNYKFPSYIRF